MGAKSFTLDSGRMTIDRDPDNIRRYGINVVDQLASEGGPSGAVASDAEAHSLGLDPLTVTACGVTIDDGFVVDGHYITAMVRGGDRNSGPGSNWIRFRVPLTNGEQFDQTLYFNLVDN